MNLENMIVFILILSLTFKFYLDNFYTYSIKKGKLINISQDNLGEETIFDISEGSEVYYLTFKKEPSFKRKMNSEIVLKEGEAFYFSIDDEETNILSIYENDELIKKIYNPKKIIFNTEKVDGCVLLKPNTTYNIYLRRNINLNEERKNFDYTINKFFSMNELLNSIPRVKHKELKSIKTNEIELRDEFMSIKEKIIDEMKEEGYKLAENHKSESFFSYPFNGVTQNCFLSVERKEVLYLISTNKKKTLQLKNYNIEIVSDVKSMNWAPNTNDNISHLRLDIEFDGNIIFYERLIQIDTKSNLLPLRILKFRK